MKALSPGKIILSGEHAVVYGKPAIAVAVDRFATTSIQTQLSQAISFDLLNFRYKNSFTIQTLREVKNRLIKQYQAFLNGECGIKEVFQTPFELAEFAFMTLFDHWNKKILHGLNIKTHSTIPIGCGMGSSAAVTLSVLRAMAQHLELDLLDENYLQLGYETEKLQHGFPSKLDLYTSLHGGCFYFQENHMTPCQSLNIPLWIVNTGIPIATTGECVIQVKSQFEKDCIWQDFESITREMFDAIQTHNSDQMKYLIRLNHQLLVKIGVVPLNIQQFIAEIEKTGAAAKICGAGATQGNNAGIVLILADTKDSIKPICDHFQYPLSSIREEKRGLHVVN